MANRNKTYKLDKNRQRLYGVILLVIAIPLMAFSVYSIVESNKDVAANEISIGQITTNEISADIFIKNLIYQRAVEERNKSIFFFILSIGMLFIILHCYFFTDRKLLLDEEGISLYSIYKKEPSKVFLWKDIKSIQFGNMYASGGRIAQYRMKIRYTKMIGTVLNNVNETISIRRFQNCNNLIKDIEQIGEIENIEVFHMND